MLGCENCAYCLLLLIIIITLIYSPKQALRRICIGCFFSQKHMNKCPLMAIWRCKGQTINKSRHPPIWSKWTAIQSDKEERHHPSFTLESIVCVLHFTYIICHLLITSVTNTYIFIFLWSRLSVTVRIIPKHFLLKYITGFKNTQGIIMNTQVP